MKRSVRNWILLIATSLPCMWLGWQLIVSEGPGHDRNAASIKIQLAGVQDRADLVRNEDGTYSYVLFRAGSPPEHVTPEELARRVYAQQAAGSWLTSVFNISSPLGLLWIGVGLVGQVLFTGRMIVQWIVSEKSRKSVVPPVFWWMSLIGSMMLLSYFVWRRDIVGMLGQSFGLVVYIRNIYLLYVERTGLEAAENGDPAVPAPAEIEAAASGQ